MNDMCNAANVLGGYLPGSNPQFMTPGLALHLGGSIRLGQSSEKNESVADYNSKVWDTKNLYVAGNGTIPTAFGANPTLTSMCFAIRSASAIDQYFKKLKKSGGKKSGVGETAKTSVVDETASLLQTTFSLPQRSAQTAAPAESADAEEPAELAETPDEWLEWLLNPDNEDYPRHDKLRELSTAIFAV